MREFCFAIAWNDRCNHPISPWRFWFDLVLTMYPLIVLGFLTDGSDELPGNFALWDQAMALNFIHGIFSFIDKNGLMMHIVRLHTSFRKC